MNTSSVAVGQPTNVQQLTPGNVQFGFGLRPEVNALLQKAAREVTDRQKAADALDEALKLAPNQLETLVAQYKFYFYQGKIGTAQELVFQALVKASLQGGFSHDWNTLSVTSTDWNDPRGPGRIFLYSLKALAFIRLRQEDTKDAGKILDVLARLDPTDQVGADVVRELLRGVTDDEDE